MTANENYSSPAKPEVKSTTASTKTKSSLTSRFTMANFPPKIKKINKKRVKTARTRQAKTKTVECYILIRESAVRGPETELMKINCPEESREKLNLSTYLIQYRVLRQPPASPDPAQRAARASKHKKHSILSHCPASSSQLRMSVHHQCVRIRCDMRQFAATQYSSRIANYPKENRLA